MSNPEQAKRDVDLLAAVVLHVLVAEPHKSAFAQIAKGVERDIDVAGERQEVEDALAVLVADELAIREGEHWRATRAARRAAELSF
jgi:hypothetical protein